VTLADRIKTVEDGNLLELVRDVPSRTATIPDSAAKTATTWMSPVSLGDVHPAPADSGVKEKAHAAHAHEREGEQEDYLWGV